MSSRLSMPPTLHNRLRELRQARSWTQEELAALTGVSRQSINSIERDRYIPSLPPVSYTHLDVYKRQPYICVLEPDVEPVNQAKEGRDA